MMKCARLNNCIRGLRTWKWPLRDKDDGVKRPSAATLLDEAATLEDERSPEAGEWATSPYPKGVELSRSQAVHSLRPRVDPRTTSIILFPGQGTQFVGMANSLKDFPPARDLFQTASRILGYDLLQLCLNGPKEKLDRTEYAQPAILVCSLAALEKLKEDYPPAVENCIATAGFSLGEISALVLAEVLTFQQAVKLVKIRAEAMQAATDMFPGAMTTVLYGPDSKLGAACLRAKEHAESLGVEGAYCGISNYLFPHCKIVAGSEEAIKFLEENKDEFKLRRLKRLPVSGAFHTPHMEPAVQVFRESLKKISINEPSVAVHSNVDGHFYRDPNHIIRQLPKQIRLPVKWEQTLHILYERPKDSKFPNTYEVGPGKSLSTILKMVNLKAWESCKNVPV